MSDKMDIVLVEILQGTQAMGGGCNCSGCSAVDSCGSAVKDYTLEAEQLANEIKENFGEKVEVKYIDVDKAGLDQYPVMYKVLQMGYPYPITLFNGQPKFAGGIMNEDIISSIHEMLA